MALFLKALGRAISEHRRAGLVAVALALAAAILGWVAREWLGDQAVKLVNENAPAFWSWMATHPVESAIGIGVAFVMFCALIATRDEAWRKIAYFMKDPDTPVLEIAWKPGEHTYRYEYMLPPDPAVNVGFRVCVTNRSDKTPVTNVRVRLETLNPHELPCVPCYLRLMNNIHPSQALLESFALNPGESQFIEVMTQKPNGDKFWIWHTVLPIDVTVKAQPYTFTISARAENATAAVKRFELAKDGLLWIMRSIDG